MIEATEKQLGLLWHTLGLYTQYSDRRFISRNHFLSSPAYDEANTLDFWSPPILCQQHPSIFLHR
ncbi:MULTISPECIES: hypothetical protein [Pseudomonas]|uniref:hypothetical protein n=1 Tax=Pseudomonas TaxID=286 RepID=UPI00031D4AD8|nr:MULTISPECIES: hypothetical protein [Pseudomonas]WOB61277.1 hypothetical protein NY023_12770 [Pseudomonas sp. NBB]